MVLGIVASREHVLAGRRAIAPSELVHHEFIVRERGSGTRSAMERFFRQAQIDPPRQTVAVQHQPQIAVGQPGRRRQTR